MNSKSFDYLTHVEEILERVKIPSGNPWMPAQGRCEGGHCRRPFRLCLRRIHAGILAQELFYRTGGLAVLNAILPSEFMLNTGPSPRQAPWKSWTATQLPSLKHTPIHEGDVLLLHSVSGRNTAAIKEMAIEARKMGYPPLQSPIWNIQSQVSSRHKAAKAVRGLRHRY